MNDSKLQVIMIHKVLGHALLSDNTYVPVTHWYGTDGDECDPFTAVSCVCGSDGVGWFAIDLKEFVLAQVH